MNKFALILMIKNEERILLRCLQALESVVDYYCICDTGSTDKSIEIAEMFLETHKGCITTEPWRDFGYNRSVSFKNAYEYLKTVEDCNLENTYGLLLDADMVFVPGKMKTTKLNKTGYKIIQRNGSLEYANARLLRMDFPWKCLGVTHEYWDGSETDLIEKNICYIDDKNDGGSKHDKFQRDRMLLEKGIQDEPDNVRYVFYLAQTYSCLNMMKEAITYYKKRIQIGGWYEEVWYSYYSIGDLYKRMGNAIKFEQWMLKAFEYRRERAESVYKLAQYFREKGEHYKSYHYIKLGMNIPFPKEDQLFIEADVYNGLFHYEASIIEYYVLPDKKQGIRSSVKCLLKLNNFGNNVLSNLHFYVKPLDCKYEGLELENPFGEDYRPSAVSIDTYPMANVRFVNYWMEGGSYRTKDNADVHTHNAYMNLETGKVITKMIDDVGMLKYTTNVKGLEDIRLYNDDGLHFTATSVKEYMPNTVCTMHGDYNKDSGKYENVYAVASPFQRICEKNWAAIPGSGMFIYDWYPMRIGSIHKNNFKVHFTMNTPPIFELFRGSAPLIEVNYGENGQMQWFALVHLVNYSNPRKYYHCLVELDSSFKPTRITLPFVFRAAFIEYCISFRHIGHSLEFYTSFMDSTPTRVTIPLTEFEWVAI